MNSLIKSIVTTSTVISALITAPNALANQGYSVEGKHNVLGLKSAFGSMDIDRRGDDGDLQVSLSPYYHYQFDKTWALTFEYINGRSDDTLDIFDDIIVEDYFEYDAFAVGAKAQKQLSNRWNLYGHIALHQFETEQHIEHFSTRKQDGTGFFAAVGTEFRAYNGFGVGFEYQIIDMDEINVKAVGVSVSYMF